MIRNSLDEEPVDPNVLQPSEIQSQAQVAPPSTEPNEHPSVLLDVLAAPFRGVEDAAHGVYKLADFVTADSLPNWDKHFLGQSKTGAGKVVEGAANFLTGFIPFVGAAGKVGGAIGLAGKAGALVEAAAAGAATDFTVFDGHEERLSNLIQDHPALANPITEFLAAKADDGEIEGRLKNAIEGFGLGAVTDGLLSSLKIMKAGRAGKAGAMTAEEVAAVSTEQGARVSKNLTKLAPTRRVAEAAATPEVADLSKSLANLELDNLSGGGLFQAPEKPISRYLDTHEDVTSILSKLNGELMAKDTARGVQTVEAIAERSVKVSGIASELTGVPPETLLATLKAQNKSLAEASYILEAGARLMTTSANEAGYYAKLAGAGYAAPGMTVEQTMLASLKAQELTASLMAEVRLAGSTEGRALNARKFIKAAQMDSVDAARQLVEQFGGTSFLAPEMRKMALAADGSGAKGVSDLIRKQMSFGDRVLRAHNEYWINAILSGTKTSFVNTLGNTFTTLYQPLEQAIGGLFQKDINAVRSSLKNYAYLAQSIQDSWKFASKAILENANQLVPDRAVSDTVRGGAIDASKLVKGGLPSQGFRAEASALAAGGEGNLLSHFTNFVGETVRLPSRFLMGADELFKQLNYRAAAKTELHYRGLSKGLEGDALHSFVADGFAKTITDGGARYSESAVIQSAITQAESKGLTGRAKSDFIREYKATNWNPENSALADTFDVANLAQGVAEEATFTRPLGELGKGVQNFAASHPLFQLLVPFVRTPTNIVKYAAQRGAGALSFLPVVGKLQARNVAELASADGLVRARAMGRIGAGQMVVSMTALGALNGNLTGKGPADENERKTLMATGWQPYSIKINSAEGPHYVSYARIDPLATFLGLVADWSEQAKRQDPFQSDTLQATLTAAATAVSNNVTNKTYLASLAQVIDAINQPDRKFLAFSRARVGSYVPSVLAQFNSTMDDGQTMKEVRGFFDGAINRIPGAQGMLESKRNVLGEPVDATLAQTPMSFVNPFTLSKDKNDPVFKELAQLNHGLQPPSPVVFEHVNLLEHKTAQGTTAYDRYQELTGKVSVGGKTLRDQLSRLIDSPSYQKLPLTSSSDGLDSPRLAAVKSVVNSYRRVALGQLQREVPSVMEGIRAQQQTQIAMRRGDKASALEGVQRVIAAAQ